MTTSSNKLMLHVGYKQTLCSTSTTFLHNTSQIINTLTAVLKA